MASILCSSKYFDDVDLIMADLLAPLQGKDLSDAIGVLLCDSEVDYEQLVPQLQSQLAFPVLGGTAMAMPFLDNDEEEISASLLVLHSTGYKFSFELAGPLDVANHAQQVEQLYQACVVKLGAQPKLILPFFPHMPGTPTALFINDLFALAQGTPVFGGMTTNNFISTKAAVFAQGKVCQDCMLFLCLAGELRPVFAVGNTITLSDSAPIVTKSKGNVVCQVDNKTFCDYMTEIGFAPEKRVNGVDALVQYGPLPVVVERKDRIEDNVPEVRCISYTNIEEGSAALSSDIPEGSRISFGIIRTEDVESSTQESLDKLREKMAANSQDGYKYSTFFCISCVARYFVMAGSQNTERELLSKHKPEGLAALGYYGFCEIGPTYASEDNRILNRLHNASIILCAF